MPLDGLVNDRPDLTNYSLEGLAWVLRNGNDGREWYFPDYCKCAMATAKGRWGDQVFENMTGGDVTAAHFIFINGQGEGHSVTPEIVAGRIDDFLGGRPIRAFVPGDRDEVEAYIAMDTRSVFDELVSA